MLVAVPASRAAVPAAPAGAAAAAAGAAVVRVAPSGQGTAAGGRAEERGHETLAHTEAAFRQDSSATMEAPATCDAEVQHAPQLNMLPHLVALPRSGRGAQAAELSCIA